MTVSEALAGAEKALMDAGVDNPRLDAEALLALAMGTGRAGVYARLRDGMDEARRGAFFASVERRAARYPMQYITGEAEFCGLTFSVTEDVLIPRPETELLVEKGAGLLKGAGHLKGKEGVTAADLGTGSGCIAVCLAARLPGASVYAVEKSFRALEVASRNIAAHKMEGAVKLLTGDLFGPLEVEGLAGGLDLIVSNPPYIPSGDIQALQPEVLFEPMPALDGGPDGLAVIRKIIYDAPGYLRPGGWLLMEIGFGQAEAVRGLVDSQPGLEFIEFAKDFAGIERVLVAQK